MFLPVYSSQEFGVQYTSGRLSDYEAEREEVRLIVDAVRRDGDSALQTFTHRFDGFLPKHFTVAEREFTAAREAVSPEQASAIRGAMENIERFHRRQVLRSWSFTGTGFTAGQRWLPLRSVGAYVPGGAAAYPSSVLMNVVPARVAGVREIYLCTPPGPDGKIHPLTLLAAELAGATSVFKIGGAQAVAALAYGTETVPAVQKIVGPGNLYVTLAKKEVFGAVGIDMLAGPSEILVVADQSADAAFIAADLLSQAEHDPLARAVLMTDSRDLAGRVDRELQKQLKGLPRSNTAEKALRTHGAAVLLSSIEDAWPLVNKMAPEHLELHLSDPWHHLDAVENAGAIFIGSHTPESLGDYWAGTNHVLPTGGCARFASPLGVGDFMKASNILCYEPAALEAAAPYVEILARAEGLEAHARAVAIRRDRRDDTKGED